MPVRGFGDSGKGGRRSKTPIPLAAPWHASQSSTSCGRVASPCQVLNAQPTRSLGSHDWWEGVITSTRTSQSTIHN